MVKGRSLNGGPGPGGSRIGVLTEVTWSLWQCWDRSRIPLTNSLLAPTYAFPASIIPLQSFTSWGGREDRVSRGRHAGST